MLFLCHINAIKLKYAKVKYVCAMLNELFKFELFGFTCVTVLIFIHKLKCLGIIRIVRVVVALVF